MTNAIDAIDEFSINITVSISESQNDPVTQRKIRETASLASQLNLEIGSQVILISNKDIADRLENCLVGRVTEFKQLNNAVSVAYVKFNDDSAGLVARHLDLTV